MAAAPFLPLETTRWQPDQDMSDFDFQNAKTTIAVPSADGEHVWDREVRIVSLVELFVHSAAAFVVCSSHLAGGCAPGHWGSRRTCGIPTIDCPAGSRGVAALERQILFLRLQVTLVFRSGVLECEDQQRQLLTSCHDLSPEAEEEALAVDEQASSAEQASYARRSDVQHSQRAQFVPVKSADGDSDWDSPLAWMLV